MTEAVVDSETRRPVVCIAARDRRVPISLVTIERRHYILVCVRQILQRTAGRFVSKTVGDRQIGLDPKLVLRKEKVIVVAEVSDHARAGQRSIDLRYRCLIIDQSLEIRVLETAPDVGIKECELFLPAEINSKLHGM